MKKLLITSLMLLSLFATSVVTSTNSHAAIGFLFKSRALKSFGSIAAKTGAAAVPIGLAATLPLCAVNCTVGPLYGLMVSGFGIYAAAFGLIILDDNTVVGMDFLPLDSNNPIAQKYSLSEIEIYNSELDELNSIKDTMQEELESIKEYNEIGQKLWTEYSQELDPVTVKIAQDLSVKLVNGFMK